MRKAAVTPPYCSSCFQAKPNLLHIDFEATFDGPMINPTDGISISVDNLIICLDCMARAAHLAGFSKQSDLKQENNELGEAVESLSAQLEERDTIIDDQKKLMNKFMDEKIIRRPGRPKVSIKKIMSS